MLFLAVFEELFESVANRSLVHQIIVTTVVITACEGSPSKHWLARLSKLLLVAHRPHWGSNCGNLVLWGYFRFTGLIERRSRSVLIITTGWELTLAALVPVTRCLTFARVVVFVGLFHFQRHKLLLETERLCVSCRKHIDTCVSSIKVNCSAALLVVIVPGIIRKITWHSLAHLTAIVVSLLLILVQVLKLFHILD